MTVYEKQKQFKTEIKHVVDTVQEVRYRDVDVTVYQDKEVYRYVDVLTCTSGTGSATSSEEGENTTDEECHYRTERKTEIITKPHTIQEQEAYIVDVEVPREEKREIPVWVDVPVERTEYVRVPRVVKRRVPRTVIKQEEYDVIDTVTKTIQVPHEHTVIDQEPYDYIEEV